MMVVVVQKGFLELPVILVELVELLIDNCPDNNNHPPKLSEKKLSCGISRRNPVNSQNREGTCEP
jgi:hypothetical protein